MNAFISFNILIHFLKLCMYQIRLLAPSFIPLGKKYSFLNKKNWIGIPHLYQKYILYDFEVIYDRYSPVE